MADWSKILSRGSVEDRRGLGPTAIGGGLSISGLVLYVLISYLTTGQVSIPDVLQRVDPAILEQRSTGDPSEFAGEDRYEMFTQAVLGSANDYWEQTFTSTNRRYEAPTLILFRGSTQSACGGADSRVGPHYCPLDRSIYLDETFFEELATLRNNDDVAQAYVIAHEVGHHVQQQLGLLETNSSNEESIRTELQADCFAGLWAYSIRDEGVLEQGEIQEALDAAAAVGDDRIQSTYQGRIRPENWTHGSSEQRLQAFTTGYESGELSACTQ